MRNAASIKRETITILRDSMLKARKSRESLRVNAGKAGARVKEASIPAARNMFRAEILDKRSSLAETQHSLWHAVIAE